MLPRRHAGCPRPNSACRVLQSGRPAAQFGTRSPLPRRREYSRDRKRASGPARPGGSKEDADVLGQQHVLVESDLAAGDLPGASDAPKDIPSGADVEVLLGLRPAAIDQEIRVNLDLV